MSRGIQQSISNSDSDSDSDSDRHNPALGQYETYLDVLEMKQIDRIMYLAMPYVTHTFLSTKEYFRYMTKKRKVKFILFVPETITIEKWIE